MMTFIMAEQFRVREIAGRTHVYGLLILHEPGSQHTASVLRLWLRMDLP